jgi:hypothetical protein
MRRNRICLIVGVAIGLTAGSLRAADPWRSAQALPKDPNTLTLRGNATRPGNEIAGQAFQIVWPARVQKIDGQWILVGDTGGYSVPPVKGWVRKDEMLCLRDDGETTGDDPSQYLSNKMLETTDLTSLATLLWMRGIYWESQQESQVAVRDYSAAIRCAFGQRVDLSLTVAPVVDLFNPNQDIAAAGEAFGRFPGLADAYLRLARLTAKSLDVAGSGNEISSAATSQTTSSEPWKTYFSCADYLFRLRASSLGLNATVPALDTEWADALAADYARLLKAQPRPSKAKTSKISYQSRDPKAGNATSDQQSSETEAMAARADALYQSALKVNPSWTNALLGRGQLLLGKGQRLVKAQGSKPSQESQALFVEAIQQYALAIQFNPKSKPAYQGRAQAYLSLAGHPRLKQRFEDRSRCLSQAASSADMACQLGRDRDPVCLQLMAEVFQNQGEICSVSQPPQPRNATTFYKQASYYWQEAASCPNAPDRSQMQVKASSCRKMINEQQSLVTESSRDEKEPAPEPQVPFYVPGANLFGDANR